MPRPGLAPGKIATLINFQDIMPLPGRVWPLRILIWPLGPAQPQPKIFMICPTLHRSKKCRPIQPCNLIPLPSQALPRIICRVFGCGGRACGHICRVWKENALDISILGLFDQKKSYQGTLSFHLPANGHFEIPVVIIDTLKWLSERWVSGILLLVFKLQRWCFLLSKVIF